MRREDREVKDIREIERIIACCNELRLGLLDGNESYIVPLCFGYEDKTFYIHSAREGRKIDLLKKAKEEQRSVGFELDRAFSLIKGEKACSFSCSYESVIGTASVDFIEDLEEKKRALGLIMAHYTKKTDYDLSKENLAAVSVIKLEVKKMSCKRH